MAWPKKSKKQGVFYQDFAYYAFENLGFLKSPKECGLKAAIPRHTSYMLKLIITSQHSQAFLDQSQYSWSFQATQHNVECPERQKNLERNLKTTKQKARKKYMRENGFMKLEFPYHEANICNGGVKMHFWKKEQKCTFTRCQKGVKYFPHLGSKHANKQN